jgi:hypothetical protein
MVSAIRPARRTAYGLEDPEALFASFRPYIDTGPGVMAGVANKMDEDEMTEIIKNPYDQQDPATYRVKPPESSHGIANGRAAARQPPSHNHRRMKLWEPRSRVRRERIRWPKLRIIDAPSRKSA